MITREQAEKFIISQFENLDANGKGINPNLDPWHYGRMELHKLLNAIYNEEKQFNLYKKGKTK